MDRSKQSFFGQNQELNTFQQSRAVQIFQKQLIKQLKSRKQRIDSALEQARNKLFQNRKLFQTEIQNKIDNHKSYWINSIQRLFQKLKQKISQKIVYLVQSTLIQQNNLVSKQLQQLSDSIKILQSQMMFSNVLDLQNKSKIDELNQTKQQKKLVLTQFLNGNLHFQLQRKLSQIKQTSNSKLFKFNWQFNQSPLKKLLQLAQQIYLDPKNQQFIVQSNANRKQKQQNLSKLRPLQSNFKILPQYSQQNSVDLDNLVKSKQVNTPQKVPIFNSNKLRVQNKQSQSSNYKQFKSNVKTNLPNNFNPFESIEEFKKETIQRSGKRNTYRSVSKKKQKEITQNLNNLIILSQKKKLLLQHLQNL